MRNKRFILYIAISIILFEAAVLYSITFVKADETIPEEYYQDFNLNGTYVYDILNADSSYIGWWGLDWAFKENVETIAGNQIVVNFTGFYEKHSGDYSSFPNPAPYISIQFVGNTTLLNVTNAEAASTLLIGYFSFLSGFFVPLNSTNVNWLKDTANNTNYDDTELTITETSSYILFDFIQISGAQRTELIYNITSGLLLWARTRMGFNTFEIALEGFTPPQDSSILPINPYLVIIIASLIIGSPFLIVPKVNNKTKKLIFIAMIGTCSFTLLFQFNSNLYGAAPLLEENVSDITINVNYNNGTIRTVEDISLSNYETSAFYALKSCSTLEYEDYGWGILVKKVDGIGGGFSSWTYTVNGIRVKIGASKCALHDGDIVNWTYS